jgi:hypothetical protein
LTKLPLPPLLDSNVSAVLPVCSASAELSSPTAVEADDVPVEADDVLVDDVDVFDDELDALEELPVVDELDVVDDPDVPEVLDDAAVGRKNVLPTPKPTFAASVPPILIVEVSLSPLMVS